MKLPLEVCSPSQPIRNVPRAFKTAVVAESAGRSFPGTFGLPLTALNACAFDRLCLFPGAACLVRPGMAPRSRAAFRPTSSTWTSQPFYQSVGGGFAGISPIWRWLPWLPENTVRMHKFGKHEYEVLQLAQRKGVPRQIRVIQARLGSGNNEPL